MCDGSGLLVLLRHEESTANAGGLITGALDVPLTDGGAREAREAGALLISHGLRPRSIHSSELARAVETAGVVAELTGQARTAVRRDARLDERNYGALTGRTKSDVLAEVGRETFLRWRRSVDVAPPPMPDDQYRRLAARRTTPLSRTESLRDVIRRVTAFHREIAVPALRTRSPVLVVGHGNSLRAYCAILEDLDDRAVEELNIPTGQPLVHHLGGDLRSATPGGRYLDEQSARRAADLVAEQGGT